MNTVEIIAAKRDGRALSTREIHCVIDGYTRGVVAPEQQAALAMAIYLRGMNRREIHDWTAAMIASGQRLEFKEIIRPLVDKHSTGGVGDKITLILTPLVAACGASVPQLSGRGLGFAGGTLDKLESIPGWSADVSPDRMRKMLADPAIGGYIGAAGEQLAPADRKLYALRDVTGTVESIPLIASSIMSKKIAEGTDALVLDVKVGSGAYMKTLDDATELARTMVDLGNDAGVSTLAVLTAMDTPLGRTAGNALEVAEAVEVLAGGGPDDVRNLTLLLAREMLELAGLDVDPEHKLDGGAAMDHWRSIVRAQGGDPDAPLPVARHTQVVTAAESGVLTVLDAMAVGRAAWRLGAGRAVQTDAVQAGAGVRMHVKPGETVRAGDPLFTLHTDSLEAIGPAQEALAGGWKTGTSYDPVPLVLGRVGAE